MSCNSIQKEDVEDMLIEVEEIKNLHISIHRELAELNKAIKESNVLKKEHNELFESMLKYGL